VEIDVFAEAGHQAVGEREDVSGAVAGDSDDRVGGLAPELPIVGKCEYGREGGAERLGGLGRTALAVLPG
jgi:hypothetical protein